MLLGKHWFNNINQHQAKLPVCTLIHKKVYRNKHHMNSTFLCPRDRRLGGILFLSCLSFSHSAILSFCPPLWNFNLANNFWTVSPRALIFHMNIPCDKICPNVMNIPSDKIFLLVLNLLTLTFDLFFKIDIGHTCNF